MATYTAKGTYNDADMNEESKRFIEEQKRLYAEAKANNDTAGMQAAHDAAEEERLKWGYSGGADGSEKIPTYTAKGTYNDAGITSGDDKALIEYYQKMYAEAASKGDTVGMDAAHRGAEGVRAQYGYSGGADGSERIDIPKVANNNSDYIQQMYDAKKKAGLAALKAAYDKNVATLDAAGNKIPGVYDTARNRTAAEAAKAQKNFNQQAVAAGLSSGTSAQAALANSVALQGNLNSINQAESDALAELELQRTNIATEYENAVAQAEANGNYELAAALYQEAIRVDEFYAAQQKQLDAQAQQDYKNGLEMAQYLFKNTGDAYGLKAYGYSDEQIANLQSQWQIDNTPKAEEPATYKPTLTAAQVLDALNNGVVNDTTLAAYQHYFGQPWEQPNPNLPTAPTQTIEGNAWTEFLNRVKMNMNMGNVGNATALLNEYRGIMNPEQIAQVEAIINPTAVQTTVQTTGIDPDGFDIVLKTIESYLSNGRTADAKNYMGSVAGRMNEGQFNTAEKLFTMYSV